MRYVLQKSFTLDELKGRKSDFFIYIIKDIIDEAKIKYGTNIERSRFTFNRFFYEEMIHRMRYEVDYNIKTTDFDFEVENDIHSNIPYGHICNIPFLVNDMENIVSVRLDFEVPDSKFNPIFKAHNINLYKEQVEVKWDKVHDPIYIPRGIRFAREKDELKWDQTSIIDDKKVKETLNRIYGLITEDKSMKIREVIFHNPATIVYWGDGSKTVVKCGKGETFDKEKGLAMAISKKVLGTNKTKSNYNDIFKKWCYEKED